MARTASSRRKAAPEIGPRELFLAGLGAASLTRRYALELGGDAAAKAGALRRQADASIKDAIARIERGRDQAARKLEPLVDALDKRVAELRARLPERLQQLAGPVPARKKAGARRGKPAAKKRTARRAR